MYSIFFRSMIVASVVTALIGCKESEVATLLEDSNSSPTLDDTLSPAELEGKLSILEANTNDLELFIVDCKNSKNNDKGNGKKPKNVCAQICHIPPGNASKMKSKILPLSALSGHILHGEGDHHIDLLGTCEDNFNAQDNTTGNNSSEEEQNTSSADDESTGDTSTSDEEEIIDTSNDTTIDDIPFEDLPIWCQQNYEIDANCDGLTDDTGIPIY